MLLNLLSQISWQFHVPNIGLKKILLKKQLKSSPKIFINKNTINRLNLKSVDIYF